MSLIIMRDDRPRARDRIGPGSSWEKQHRKSIQLPFFTSSFLFHSFISTIQKKYMIILRASRWIYMNSMVSIKKLKQSLQSAQSKKLNSTAAVAVWIKFMWEFFHVYSLDFVAQWATIRTALGVSHKVNSATIYYTNFVRFRRDSDLTCSAGEKLIFVLEIAVLFSTLSVISSFVFWQGTSMTFSVVMWWVIRFDLTFISYFG